MNTKHAIAPIELRVLAFMENIIILILFSSTVSQIFMLFPVMHGNMFTSIAAFLSPLLIMAIIQSYLLSTRGQSIGKIHCGIKIVRYSDGGKVGFLRAVFLREIIFKIILFFSFGLANWADIIMLFADKEHRTLHDRVAGTIVVGVNENVLSKNRAMLGVLHKKIIWLIRKIVRFLPFIVVTFIGVLPLWMIVDKGRYDIFSSPPSILAAILFRFSDRCNPEYISCYHSRLLNSLYYNPLGVIIVHLIIFVLLAVVSQFAFNKFFKLKK